MTRFLYAKFTSKDQKKLHNLPPLYQSPFDSQPLPASTTSPPT